MNLTESLQHINALRQNVTNATEAYEQGKTAERPSVSLQSIDLMERMARNVNGDFSMGRANIRETLQTTDVVKLIPKVLEGQLREAAEPEYLGTRFMKTVHVEGGSSTVFVIPVVGELVASEVGEGTRYNEDNLDQTTIENSTLEIRVKKIGLKVSITEEAIQDSSFDILGLNTRKMGRAMARYKEEWIFNSFSSHGRPVFNNAIRSQAAEAGTTGRAADGTFNDTMSSEDFLELVMALMGQGMNPTDVIMHPLVWTVFARNSMVGNGMTWGALGGQNIHPWGAVQGTPGPFGLANNGEGQQYIMEPSQVQNRIPFPLTINFSPFVNFDKVSKRFDMYCIDRNEVGTIAQKEALSMDEWTNPEVDVRLLKTKERYGVGIDNNGRGITTALNIAAAPTYPVPPTVTVNTKSV